MMSNDLAPMTGRKLIDWIKTNKAEDMLVAVQYRDGGGNYMGGEFVTSPTLANVCVSGLPYDDSVDISYDNTLFQNAIIL